jgi:hypothetical protein
MLSLKNRRFRMAALAALLVAMPLVHADEAAVRGQLLYVPVYSEVPFGDKSRTLTLTATLSVRNTDRKSPVTVKRVDYFSAAGTLIRSYLRRPEPLKPMASAEYLVMESDRSGGISASFLVEWESEAPVSAPYVEAVMVHASLNQSVAFGSPARVLEEKR